MRAPSPQISDLHILKRAMSTRPTIISVIIPVMDARSFTLPRIAALALAVLILAAAACADPPLAPASTPAPTAEAAPDTPAPSPAPAPTPRAAAPSHTPAPTAEPPPLDVDAFDSLGALSQLALGESHACGLREDGRAVCVGIADEWARESAAFSAVSSGKDYACGLRDDGAVSCWGRSSPHCETCAPEGAFAALSAGKRHACALDADGAATCWGWNDHGRATPPPGARFAAIAAGGAHSCGVAEFGNLICWGGNLHGQSEPNEGPFSALALGANHTCALRTDGSAFCQGDDSRGQASPPPSVFAQIAAGDRQTCGIAPDGGLECWGMNAVSDHSEKFASVSVGYGRICALTAGGAARCLGSPSAEDPTDGAALSNPVEMFPLPDGGVAVAERRGYIEIYPPDGGEPRIALDLTARTRCCRQETGMFGAALDPDFTRFPFIYVYWQTDADDPGGDVFEGRVSRFPATSGGDIDADGELVILRLPQTGEIHFGGAIRFGADGMLHLGLGDRAEADANAASAADLSSLAGKIIRIDVRGATESRPYRAPPDNPFVGVPGARAEIWALGLRNPWRMSFAPNGDLIVADVGDHSREEVSIAARGANLGWPLFEGSLCVSQDARCDDVEGYAFPIHEYAHGGGECAIIGGMSAPDGKYVFGDYCGGRVWTLERVAPDVWEANEIMDTSRSITAFGSDADGTIYALTSLGPVAVANEQRARGGAP